jgi:hypothetical protein
LAKESWLLPDEIKSVKPTTWQADFRIKWVNYLDEDGKWKEIIPEFKKQNTGFIADQGPFTAIAPLTSIGTFQLINNNRYDLFKETTITENPLTESITALNVSEINGKIETGDFGMGPAQYVVYKNAYPDLEVDLIYWVYQGVAPRLVKIVRFNNPAKIPVDDFDIEFKISYDNPVYIQREIDGQMVGWTLNSPLYNYEGPITVKTTENRLVNDPEQMRGIGIKPIGIWDSGRKSETIPIDLIPTENNDEFILVKKLPVSFFNDAEFPVYTDDSLTVYPNPHIEVDTVDGTVSDAGNTLTWANLIIEPGSEASDNSAGGQAFSIQATLDVDRWLQLDRSIFLFKTSSIGVGGTIISATLSLCGKASKADNLGITPNINIYSAAPASSTALVAGDFDSLGTTAFSTAITYAGWGEGLTVYNDFALNAAGIAAIDMTGISKFGARNANYDVSGTPPTWSSGNLSNLDVYFAEQALTTSDPKLVVNYSLIERNRLIITQ